MTPAELREMVAVMRELGVEQCDGIVLGPSPSKLELLERKAADTDPRELSLDDRLALEREREYADREAKREATRNLLSANGRSYTDAELDRFNGYDS